MHQVESTHFVIPDQMFDDDIASSNFAESVEYNYQDSICCGVSDSSAMVGEIAASENRKLVNNLKLAENTHLAESFIVSGASGDSDGDGDSDE